MNSCYIFITVFGIATKSGIRMCFYTTFLCTKFQSNRISHFCLKTTFRHWKKKKRQKLKKLQHLEEAWNVYIKQIRYAPLTSLTVIKYFDDHYSLQWIKKSSNSNFWPMFKINEAIWVIVSLKLWHLQAFLFFSFNTVCHKNHSNLKFFSLNMPIT